MLQDNAMAHAWREYAAGAEHPARVVRPEIARSWARCRKAAINPWSNTRRYVDEARLDGARNDHERLIRVADPVMRVVSSLLACNVSLMDKQGYVYHLVSPFSNYSLTVGQEMREELVGTCNAALVQVENKPVRCDYFEHYRVCSQAYSGASAPFLYEDGTFGGAINLNSPLLPLPPNAETMASVVARQLRKLFFLNHKAWQPLSSVEFFAPLFALLEGALVVTDGQGHVLTVNDEVLGTRKQSSVPPYGTELLGRWVVGGEKTARKLMALPVNDPLGLPPDTVVEFGRSKQPYRLTAVRQCSLSAKQVYRFFLFERYSEPTSASKEPAPASLQQDVVGKSPDWREVLDFVDHVAPLKVNTLLLGESGTGKEVIARAIHNRSGRKGPFVAVNCGALPRDLLASELFGYAPGAFTGANAEGLLGKFEFSSGGTLFLDEIGEMPPDMQVGLLRVLQEREVTPLGSNQVRPVDIRVIAATNQDVAAMLEARTFRNDLYHRLSQVELTLPPLRQRVGDIPLFVEHFNRQVSTDLGIPHSPFSAEALEAFLSYEWPGNVRELRNVVERCLIFCGQGSEVLPEDVRNHILRRRG